MGMTSKAEVKWRCPSCREWVTERINLKCESCRAKADYGQRDHGDECPCPQCKEPSTNE